MTKTIIAMLVAIMLTACSDNVVQRHNDGIVTAKYFTPSSSGVGVGATANGQVAMVTTSSDASYIIELNHQQMIHVTKEEFPTLVIGQHVIIDEYYFHDDIKVIPE